ncbi:DUF397 domain-containing protein [Actinopolyspora erythraea]|uniref:DUF397 domain-containing protein n=1 Tax=Actinopolyspora erythraea TaxID=414996 RepID=UPI001CB7A07D|nr:DUF397 domain-containing protein [Actinopolyspora erythraea]
MWRKSSRSGGAGSGSGNCVEVAFGEGFAAVRDSKSPETGVFAVPTAQWRSFLASVRAGGERNRTGHPGSCPEPTERAESEVPTVEKLFPRPHGSLRQ